MRNIKQWHKSALIAVLLSILGFVNSEAYDFSYNGIYYNINRITGTAEVTCGDDTYNSYSGQVVIPQSVPYSGRTYDVAAVGDNAFRNCSGLTAVTIGENVAAIGKRAFLNCSSLAEVNIPGAVTVVGDYAFAQCTSLNEVNFNNDAALDLGAGAFLRCSQLADVNWVSCIGLDGRGGLTSVGTNAFAQCSSLSSISLPGELQMMGTTIFEGCNNLTSITLSRETPLMLNGDPFALDVSNVSIYVPSSGNSGEVVSLYSQAVGWRDYIIVELPYTFIDENQVIYFKTTSGDVTLTGYQDPSIEVLTVISTITDFSGNVLNVTSIADEAFKGTGIKTLDASNAKKLKSIGTEAFANCTHLSSLLLCEGVSTMGDRAFAGCTSLTAVQVPSTLRVISKGAFMDCLSLNSVTLVMGVATISEDAFARCSSLESISLPRSIASVETHAFRHAISLEQISVDPRCQHYASCDGVLFERKYGEGYETTEIGEMSRLVLYPMCKQSEDFYVPCGVTTIDDNAMEEVMNLKALTIPATTTIFGNECFKGANIETINYRNPDPVSDGTSGITTALKSQVTLQVPVGATANYNALSEWSGFKNIVEQDYAFIDQGIDYDWNDKRQVTIVYVHHSAVNSSGMLTLPAKVAKSGYAYDITQIRNNSTRNLSQDVTSLVINSDSLSVIDTSDDLNPIAVLSNLQSISVTSSNPYLKVMDNALYSKNGDKLYFYLNTNTEHQFVLPNSVKMILPQAFCGNQHLETITFNSMVKQVGGRAFEGCYLLQSVDNAKAVSIIGNRAFANCAALKTFSRGERLNEIGDEAFINCNSLVCFPFSHGMLKSIGNSAFKNCSSLVAAVLGSNLTSVGDCAFEYCTALSKVVFSAEVETLGIKVFKGCSALNEVWMCNAQAPDVDSEFFSLSGISTAQLFVPADNVSNYSSKSPWNNASSINACSYLYNSADVNNDRVVNSLDVTLTMSVLLGNQDEEVVGHFDVNHDGSITAVDITVIYNYILTGTNMMLPYRFLSGNYGPIFSNIGLNDEHTRILAFKQSTNQPVDSGLSGFIDNPGVAQVVKGTSNGIQYLEIVPVATGYFTLVAIVSDGATFYYRAYPFVVGE